MSQGPQHRFEETPSLDAGTDPPARDSLTGAPRGVYDEPVARAEVTVAPDARPAAEQPAWRQDFPIDWPNDQFVARRDFAKFLVLTSAAFVAGQGWIAAQDLVKTNRAPAPRVRIASVREVPVGTSKMFEYPPGKPCLLVHVSEDTLVAFSQQCTHLSCAVVPKVAEGVFHCPCHEGYFDLMTGRNIAGPPPRPLPKVLLEREGDDVFAVGVEERTV
jgi:nitrite reductase/ring-hydroxylating ferredoxin subunit